MAPPPLLLLCFHPKPSAGAWQEERAGACAHKRASPRSLPPAAPACAAALQTQLRQLLVSLVACGSVRRAGIEPHLDAPPDLWHLSAWVLLLLTRDLSAGMEDDPPGYRLDHARAVALLQKWRGVVAGWEVGWAWGRGRT